MGNTFYQAMAFGTPVVSLVGIDSKTRGPYAGYKQMGISDPPIAKTPEEFIAITKKLAFDNLYKQKISSEIAQKSKKYLFEDKTIYKEYIDFFNAAINAAKNDLYLSEKWNSDK